MQGSKDLYRQIWVLEQSPGMLQYNNQPNKYSTCYELKPLEVGKRTNSCIGVNIRELDRVPSTK